ncbi:MAG: M50 family metallopeptidase [Melioribacteraceae bacterium]|nr:M50 family metallopeptidase [Melioribacteraceae bacterium]
MNKLSKKQKQYLELGIIAIIGIAAIILWDTPLVYPIKLFVVLMHEISHGIAAVITGGHIQAIQINEYLGGECITDGGNAFVIAFSGYTGSLFFGSILFVSGYKRKFALWSCTILSALLLVFSANFLYGGLGVALSILYTVILFLSPRYFKPDVNSYILKILGTVSLIYVVIDIKEDIFTNDLIPSDAFVLANMTGTSLWLWGSLWMIITLAVIYFLLRFSFTKGFGKIK